MMSNETTGYWEPHTSSVDFCEPNYFLSQYVVEPHNTWSSLFITYIACIGLLWGNPTKEWGISAMFAVLAIIGIGSAGLHSTLHWVLQSSDEVPMLWQILSFLHVLTQLNYSGKLTPSGEMQVSLGFIVLAIVQTIVYYCFQQIYAVFIISIVVYSTIIVVWATKMLWVEMTADQQTIVWLLWRLSFFCYVVLGAGLWILDMNLCHLLLPFYEASSGITLHVLWHIFAGMGTYLLATLLVVARLHRAGKRAELHWPLPFLPVCQEAKVKLL